MVPPRAPSSSCRRDSLRRRLDRLDDVHVAGAPADVALNRLPNLLFTRLRMDAQERGRAYQHPRGAVAALEGVVIGERLLQRRELAVLGESLDGLDLCTVGLDRQQHAALHEEAVHEHGTGTTVAGVAADVASGQIEVVTDEMDEETSRVHLALVRLAVDLDRDRLARDDVHLAAPR